VRARAAGRPRAGRAGVLTPLRRAVATFARWRRARGARELAIHPARGSRRRLEQARRRRLSADWQRWARSASRRSAAALIGPGDLMSAPT